MITTCTSEQIDPWPTSSIYTSGPVTVNSTTVRVPPSMSTSNVSTTTTACFNSTVTTTIIVSIVSTDWSTTTCTTTTTTTDTTTDTITDTMTDTITDTITDTVTDTVTDIITDVLTDTITDTTTETTTDTTTETTTDTTTVTTTDTVTTPTTITVAPNPCPTTCSITSPSVYMVVNTIYGTNTAGRAGPSGTSLVFPLDLNQVSTIDLVNSATRQLTLNDLGTDCPQTEDPSVIATAAPNGRCDPILVAPEPVKSWASPCNACGQFGLFDPPLCRRATHWRSGAGDDDCCDDPARDTQYPNRDFCHRYYRHADRHHYGSGHYRVHFLQYRAYFARDRNLFL
ncbi:hypothetical protein N7526_002897 [Penicillium atrosanguineum]|nr:hypothetical protein N7526_002897 [Penicillium atrosanguineum]